MLSAGADGGGKTGYHRVGGYLRKIGRESNAEIIKGIACRATGYQSFNKIPAERLRNVYHAFRNKQKDIDSVERIAIEYLAQNYYTAGSSALPN